jgi:cytochrome d ubiquinol oxidase subunit I
LKSFFSIKIAMESALLFSRIQFAANISFHILFPAITIALGWFLLFFKIRFQISHNQKWINLYFFWTKIFALCFAMGVVSGITMSFQFGTNWPGFMNTVGNIAGPLLGYEVLTAFFLEATFLGIMLFGFKKVKPWLHTTATALVAIGTTLSAFWILVLNSWMHTPSGFEMINGEAVVTNWLEVIFNPSMPYRFTHKVLASGLTASFLIAGLSAYRSLKRKDDESAKLGIKFSVIVASILIPIQILVGDMHGLNTLEHQPQKVAAMEGVWETSTGIPLVLFALPNESKKINEFAIEIPKLSSFILTHDFNGEVKGISEFENKHPPVAAVFWSFRVMVGMGVLMLLVSWWASYYIWRTKRFPKVLNTALVLMTFSGWVATLAGWYTTEVGRQPYLVNGVLRVEDAVTSTPASHVGLTLLGYLFIYALLLFAFITTLFYLAGKERELVNTAIDPKTGQRRSLLAT